MGQFSPSIWVNYTPAITNKNNSRINSVNKQQKLVGGGVEAAETQYIARVRTDFVFVNNRFLKYYQKWNKIMSVRTSNLIVFKERVLAYRVNMVNPRLHEGHFSYQLSDCFLFGTKEDLGFIFDGHRESIEAQRDEDKVECQRI